MATPIPTAQVLAEAIERARYEAGRPGGWEQLRPSEREVRIGVCLQALAETALHATLDDMVVRIERAEQAAETALARAAENATAAAERDAHAARVAELERLAEESAARARDAELALEVARAKLSEASAELAEAARTADSLAVQLARETRRADTAEGVIRSLSRVPGLERRLAGHV